MDEEVVERLEVSAYGWLESSSHVGVASFEGWCWRGGAGMRGEGLMRGWGFGC